MPTQQGPPPPQNEATGSSNEDDAIEEDPDQEDSESEFSQRRLKKKFKKKKNTTGIVYAPYLVAAAWLQRSYAIDIIWPSVLTRGVAWDFQVYNPYTKAVYEEKFKTQIAHYNILMDRVPSLARDREILRKDSGAIELLGANMVDAANQARSNDIYGLKDKFLQYLALEVPPGSSIPNQPDKSDRGFKNRYTAQFLVPAILRSQFDGDPDNMMAELLNGKSQYLDEDTTGSDGREVSLDETEFPSFMWPEGGFVPGVENRDINFFRSPLLVRVFRHIFTTPSSALKNLDDLITKSVRGMANKEKMHTVTPASIAYACTLLRHTATCATSWDQNDRSFNYQKYFGIIMSLFDKTDEDADVEWIDDTIKWWNIKIFGTECPDYDGPMVANSRKRSAGSTLEDIKKARAAKRQRRMEAAQAEASVLPAASMLQTASNTSTEPRPNTSNHTAPSSSNQRRPIVSPEQPMLRPPLGPSIHINSSTLVPPTPAPSQARVPRRAQQASEFDDLPHDGGSLHSPINPEYPSRAFHPPPHATPTSRQPAQLNSHHHYPPPPHPQHTHTQSHAHLNYQDHQPDHRQFPGSSASAYPGQYGEGPGPGGQYPPQTYQ